MRQPPPLQMRGMFIGRMVRSLFFLCLALALVYGSIELAMFRHRALTEWPEVEGRVVAREFNTANKGGRVYWVAFRFRMAEGTLVTSRWTTVQVALPHGAISIAKNVRPGICPARPRCCATIQTTLRRFMCQGRFQA